MCSIPIDFNRLSEVVSCKKIVLYFFNNSLNKHFGFKTFKHSDKTNESKDVGISLTKEQIDRIYELNSLDMEVYEYVQKTQKRY